MTRLIGQIIIQLNGFVLFWSSLASCTRETKLMFCIKFKLKAGTVISRFSISPLYSHTVVRRIGIDKTKLWKTKRLEKRKGATLIYDYKQLIENFHRNSLLLICGKILEWLNYKKIFEFLNENILTNPSETSFKSGDSA